MIEAHAEAWLDYEGSYWLKPSVHDAVMAVTELTLGAPSLIPSPWLPRLRTDLAFALAKVGETDLAKEQFEILGTTLAGPFVKYHSAEQVPRIIQATGAKPPSLLS